jgi:hypothetical protein
MENPPDPRTIRFGVHIPKGSRNINSIVNLEKIESPKKIQHRPFVAFVGLKNFKDSKDSELGETKMCMKFSVQPLERLHFSEYSPFKASVGSMNRCGGFFG